MLTILIWLGSGFAFAIGMAVGIRIQVLVNDTNWFRAHCQKILAAQTETAAGISRLSEDSARIAAELARLAKAAEKE